MMIDFTTVSDEQKSFELLPEGKRLLKVVECKESMTQNNNEMWSFTYEDKDGNKVWDRLIFTPNTLNRVKKCFSNLGLDVNGKFEYQPDDVLGLYMNAELKIESYSYTKKKEDDTTETVTGQKNTIDLWQSEKYQSTAKKASAKPKVEEENSELPF